MLVEEVRKLPPIERFLYWIRERHNIHIRRKNGQPKPWTDDTILQENFFTNPYRENDKTTVWFREKVRDRIRDRPEVLFATVAFRWFNLIRTGEVLLDSSSWEDKGTNLLLHWNERGAVERLGKERELGHQVFTGAFIINSPAGQPKLEAICRRVDNVWRCREALLEGFKYGQASMKDVHTALTQYEGLGGFMAYEVVCDLRYTSLLENVPDKVTWCNPGPGAIRGVYRLLNRDFEKGNNASSPPRPKDWEEKTLWLLGILQKRLSRLPSFEMREVEHSLCEWDKYERLLHNDGRPKRKYNGVK